MGILTEAQERETDLTERLLSLSRRALPGERPAVIQPEVGVAAEREHYLVLRTTTHEPTTQGAQATVHRPVPHSAVLEAMVLLAIDAHEQAPRGDALVISTVVVACTAKGVPVRPRRVLWQQTWVAGDEG